MNEKVRKVLSWIAGVGAFLLALLCGRWKRNLNNKRVSDATDSVADGRQTVDGIRESNKQLADTVEECDGNLGQLEDTVRQSADTACDAGRAVGNAHDAVRFGIEILEQAEKRNNAE